MKQIQINRKRWYTIQMGLFKKIFQRETKYVDETGIYQSVQCGKCKTIMQVRIDKKYDLNREGTGYVWRKTLVCDSCYQQMPTTIFLNNRHQITDAEITKGEYVDAPDSA